MPYTNGVTIGLDRTGDHVSLIEKMEIRHHGDHDTVVVFVPKGRARDARDRIWTALDAAPHQNPGDFERDQALAYDNNIKRMFGSL